MHRNKLELFFLLLVSVFNSLMAQDEGDLPTSSEIEHKKRKLHRNNSELSQYIFTYLLVCIYDILGELITCYL